MAAPARLEHSARVASGRSYFAIWTVLGTAVFPVGVTLAEVEMQHPALAHAVPRAIGVVVLTAGALQFSGWKSRQLAGCRELPTCGTWPADAHTSRQMAIF